MIPAVVASVVPLINIKCIVGMIPKYDILYIIKINRVGNPIAMNLDKSNVHFLLSRISIINFGNLNNTPITIGNNVENRTTGNNLASAFATCSN